MKVNLEKLSKRLNYHFENKNYLKQALTHCSSSSDNYERFEFLGDSILSFVIAKELFIRFPSHTEGQLSRLRSFLVKGEMLSEIAREIELGGFLFLGQGELKSGGFRRSSILADALEAVIAAIYLDSGINAATKAILKLYRSRLDDPHLNDCLKDAKTQLQELLQASKYPLPEYILTKVEGGEHDQMFYVSCTIKGISQITYGEGSNRRKAEQLAANVMLKWLQANVLNRNS